MGERALATITPAYAQEQARLHATDPMFGAEGHLWAYLVAGIAQIEGCGTVLDYGCGKGTLAKALDTTDLLVGEYDPGVPGKDIAQEPADLVVCLDVLEHVEPKCLDAVLDDLTRLTAKLLFMVAANKPSKRIMSDGRDTHLIIGSDEFWLKKFTERGLVIRRTWNTGLRATVALMGRS